uniref:(northern house mosquito) hypothetical protein n=1 Tax=Culex pipiens TaxID=7175 RepID=A0A8D8B7L3_CULPI
MGKNQTKTKTTSKRSQTVKNNTLKNDMLLKVVKLWRCSDGWQHCSRSCQKIKVFKLKVRSVLVVQNHPKPHISKVNFRNTFPQGRNETITAQGNHIFTFNLKYFVN